MLERAFFEIIAQARRQIKHTIINNVSTEQGVYSEHIYLYVVARSVYENEYDVLYLAEGSSILFNNMNAY